MTGRSTHPLASLIARLGGAKIEGDDCAVPPLAPMVTVAVDWTMVAFDGLDKTTVKLRLGAEDVRLVIGTEMLCSV